MDDWENELTWSSWHMRWHRIGSCELGSNYALFFMEILS